MSDSQEKEPISVGWFVAAVILIWLAAPILLSGILGDYAKQGQFGDQFGAVNALFSGLAFAVIVYTVILQQKQLLIQKHELALQRQELALQREEMKGSREELRNQVKMQAALIKATIAQVVVASSTASIEADKIEANEVRNINHEHFKDRVASIRNHASALSKLASMLEEKIPNVG